MCVSRYGLPLLAPSRWKTHPPSSVILAMSAKAVILFCLLPLFASQIHAYCWQPGRNPSFIAAPMVEQTALDRLRITWSSSIIRRRECADQFLVKFWPCGHRELWMTSRLVQRHVNSVEIRLQRRGCVRVQAVAREDKGSILGVDYNYSPTMTFYPTQDLW